MAGNLLDLVLTDLSEVRVQTLQRVADHNLLLVEVPLPLPCSTARPRRVWNWQKAKWTELKKELQKNLGEEHFAQKLERGSVTEAVDAFTAKLLEETANHVPKKTVREARGTHPWVNDAVLELVAERREAENAEREAEAARTCSQGILEEF